MSFETISNVTHWELLWQVQNLRDQLESRENEIDILNTTQLQANNISNIIEDDEDEDDVSSEIEFWKNELRFLITCSDVEWAGYMPPVGLELDENEEYTIQPCLREHLNIMYYSNTH